MRLSDRINGSKTYDFTKILNESCYYSESEDPTKGEEALKTIEDQLERNWKLKTEVGIEEAEEVLTETTNKELKAKYDAYREKQRQALRDAGDPNPESTVGIAKRLPPEVWNELDIEGTILDCIEMTHSILTYAPENNRTLEYVLDNKYIKKYIEKLGEDKVREIANQEVEEYKNATINSNAYTDSEGVTYNSVTFKDDMKESCEEKMKEADEIHGNELNEDSEVITFREIISRMENATEYTELYDAASLIKDTELRVDVEQLIGDCEDDGDSVETAYSIVTTDLLDSMIDEPNEETAPTE